MASKIILVLANSILGTRRIVAGREFIKKDGSMSVGQWFRPVTDQHQKEIGPNECKLTDSSYLTVLDIVQVPVSQKLNDPYQPESWCITNGTPWKKLSTLAAKYLRNFKEKPDSLWLEENSPTDKVSDLYLNSMSQIQSAYLVKPQMFHLELFSEDDPFERGDKKQIRAVFEYNNHEYDIALNDPVIEQKYCTRFPGVQDGKKIIELDGGSSCLLCVCLTQGSQDSHSKLVTSVIEL
jgi:hypothetical protein